MGVGCLEKENTTQDTYTFYSLYFVEPHRLFSLLAICVFPWKRGSIFPTILR